MALKATTLAEEGKNDGQFGKMRGWNYARGGFRAERQKCLGTKKLILIIFCHILQKFNKQHYCAFGPSITICTSKKIIGKKMRLIYKYIDTRSRNHNGQVVGIVKAISCFIFLRWVGVGRNPLISPNKLEE